MTDSNVFQLSQPGTLSDPLTEVLRSGARALLAKAVAAEVAGFLEGHADKLTDDGRQWLVRHGHLPEREIMTGIGPLAVRAPRIRDRVGTGEARIAFSSAIHLGGRAHALAEAGSVSQANRLKITAKSWRGDGDLSTLLQ